MIEAEWTILTGRLEWNMWFKHYACLRGPESSCILQHCIGMVDENWNAGRSSFDFWTTASMLELWHAVNVSKHFSVQSTKCFDFESIQKHMGIWQWKDIHWHASKALNSRTLVERCQRCGRVDIKCDRMTMSWCEHEVTTADQWKCTKWYEPPVIWTVAGISLCNQIDQVVKL